MTEPTIVPVPCRRVLAVRYGPPIRCGDAHYICGACEALGERLLDNAYDQCEFSNQEYKTLAWNLTIAALLCASEDRTGYTRLYRKLLQRPAESKS
jgi:hypothetical protein